MMPLPSGGSPKRDIETSSRLQLAMPSDNDSVIKAILDHLAQACEAHLHDAHLAQRLRALAAQKQPLRPNEKPPTLAEAAALLILQKKAQAIWGDGEDE